MINKENFIDIIDAARRTFCCIQGLEDALGGIDLTPERISDYLNKGDVITIHLLEMRTPEDKEMDVFVQSYWNLIQSDESLLILPNKESVLIHNSDIFYDFWARRKVNFPIECEVYNTYTTPKGTYSWDD